MARDICAFPRDLRSVAWIVSNHERIDQEFRNIHRTEESKVLQYHPHGVLLERADPETRDPDEPEVSLYIGAHWSRVHETQTEEDIKQVLLSLGANMKDLDIQSTSDAE